MNKHEKPKYKGAFAASERLIKDACRHVETTGSIPTIEEQQKVLHSPFDIETHRRTFISYLEVVISPEGVVEYAVPSHTEKLINLYAAKRGIDNLSARKEIIDKTIAAGEFDSMRMMTALTGYISVWFNHYVAGDPPTKAQLNKLHDLFKEGVYIGPYHDIVTPEREELKRIMEDLKSAAIHIPEPEPYVPVHLPVHLPEPDENENIVVKILKRREVEGDHI